MRDTEPAENWNVVQGRGSDEIRNVASFLDDEYGDRSIGLRWTPALLDWKVGDSNPAGHGHIVAANLKGRIVGSVTLTLKNFCYRGKTYLVAEIGDAYTSRSLLAKSSRSRYACSSDYTGPYRQSKYVNSGVFGRLATEAIDWAERVGVHAIYGTPNALALPGWIKRLDFRLVNTDIRTPISRVALTAKLLQTRTRLPRVIEQLCGYGITFASQLALLFPTIRLAKFDVAELRQAVGPEFDGLWRSSLGQGASIVKDGSWLSWRYQSHPDNTYRIYTLRRESELYGWLVLRTDQSEAGRTITICDWLYKTNPTLWVAFVFKVLRSVDYQRAVIRLWSCDNTPLVKQLWRLFVLRGAHVNVIFRSLGDGNGVFDARCVFDEFSIGHTDNI